MNGRQPLPVFIAVTAAVSLGLAAAAQVRADGTIRGVGQGPQITSSQAVGISADGSVVVGLGWAGVQPARAWRWTQQGGLEVLASLPAAYPMCAPTGVSADGSVIVGDCMSGAGNEYRAVRWWQTGVQELGTLPPATSSFTSGVRGDGGLVVGHSGLSFFRWMPAGGMTALSTDGVSISALSRDGLTVVGALGGRAAKWSAASGAVDLGQPGPPQIQSGMASVVSSDGTVVAGTLSGPGSAVSGFRWTESTGMVAIAGLGTPRAMSASGTRIVGTEIVQQGSPPVAVPRAVLWRLDRGAVDLNVYLPALGVNLDGWTLQHAAAVSDDGLTITGTGVHIGTTEAWVVRLSPECYPDCNGDHVLNLSDFGCFQTMFTLDPYADCNRDGVKNLADFGCFQTKFALGCP